MRAEFLFICFLSPCVTCHTVILLATLLLQCRYCQYLRNTYAFLIFTRYGGSHDLTPNQHVEWPKAIFFRLSAFVPPAAKGP